MKNFLYLLQCCCVLIVTSAAPEGLNRRGLTPSNFNGYPQPQQQPQFQPQFIPKYLPPCVHNVVQSGTAAAFIQGQSQGRIVNNAQLHAEQSGISTGQFQNAGVQHSQTPFQQTNLNTPPQQLHYHYTVPNSGKLQNAPAAPLLLAANSQQYAANQQAHQQSFTITTNSFGGTQQTHSTGAQFNGLQPPPPPPPSLPTLTSFDTFTPIVNKVNVPGNNNIATNFVQHSQQQIQQQGSIVAAELSSVGDAASLQNLDSHIFDGQLSHVIRETFESTPIDPTAEKHIYVHVPPEDLEFNQEKQSQLALPPAQVRKHYKIIFIKTPTTSATNYAQLHAAAAQQTEEKTLIYVLVKKPDQPTIEELQQLQQANTKINKPEVYFIKYKANKEGGEYKAPITDSYQQSVETQGFNVGGTSTSYANDASDAIDLRTGSNAQSVPASAALTGGFPEHDNGHSAYGVPLN